MTEYRSTKTVKAVKFDGSDHSISELKELATGDRLKFTIDSTNKKGYSKRVSVYNPEFEVFIELNIGEWLVKDGESLLILTNDEFRNSYEDMKEYDYEIRNIILRELEFQRARSQIYVNNDNGSYTINDGSYTGVYPYSNTYLRLPNLNEIIKDSRYYTSESGNYTTDQGINFIENYNY